MAKYIEAVQYAYGMSKKDAANYVKTKLRNNDEKSLKLLVEEFSSNARKSFYED